MLVLKSIRYSHHHSLCYSVAHKRIWRWKLQWLRTEALASNPKIEVTPDGRYMFKPPFKIRDKKSLLKLLRQTDLKGLGGILLEDVQESLPNHEKILKVSFVNLYFVWKTKLILVLFSNLRKTLFTSLDQSIKRRFCSSMIKLLTCRSKMNFRDFGDQ